MSNLDVNSKKFMNICIAMHKEGFKPPIFGKKGEIFNHEHFHHHRGISKKYLLRRGVKLTTIMTMIKLKYLVECRHVDMTVNDDDECYIPTHKIMNYESLILKEKRKDYEELKSLEENDFDFRFHFETLDIPRKNPTGPGD